MAIQSRVSTVQEGIQAARALLSQESISTAESAMLIDAFATATTNIKLLLDAPWLLQRGVVASLRSAKVCLEAAENLACVDWDDALYCLSRASEHVSEAANHTSMCTRRETTETNVCVTDHSATKAGMN